jgi:hypothetical protein
MGGGGGRKKLVPKKACREGVEFSSILILNLVTRQRPAVNVTPRPLYSPEQNMGGGAAEAGWTIWRTDKWLVLDGIRIPDRPTRSLVHIPTTVSWLTWFEKKA